MTGRNWGLNPVRQPEAPLIAEQYFNWFLSVSIEEAVNLLMNIPPFMSVSTDPSEVIDFEVRVCWTTAQRLASCYCSDPIMQTQSLAFPRDSPSSLSVSPLKDRLISSVQSSQPSRSCTFPNDTPLGFVRQSVWPGAQGHRAFCSASPSPALLFFCLSRRFGRGLEQSGPEPLHAEEGCKMAPRRKSETCAPLSVSGVGNNFRLRSFSGPSSTLGKYASMHEGTQGD